MGVALKTISNYTDHISPTELDQAVSIRELTLDQRQFRQVACGLPWRVAESRK